MSLRGRLGVLVALLAFLPALILAQKSTANVTTASTFFLNRTKTQFSVNIANNSEDVFFYFASPAYSWVGVGFGEKMEDSLMLIMYPNSKGDNVTLSPRMGSKHSEPVLTNKVSIDILPGTHTDDESLILHARCSNCRKYIDVKNVAHPMIYAFGNGHDLQSDSLSAGLKRHVRYGHFTMNMQTAAGTGAVPAKSNALNGVSMRGEMREDNDRANLAHGIVGCVAIFVLWPANVFFAGFFKNIKIHFVVSGFIVVFLIASYALGGITAAQYNRSKTYNNPHQTLALLSLIPFLLLCVLPIPSLSALHAKIPKLHRSLASATFVLLIITGGLGLRLGSQARTIILVYSALSLAVFVAVLSFSLCIRSRGTAHARAKDPQRLDQEEPSHEMVVMTAAKIVAQQEREQQQQQAYYQQQQQQYQQQYQQQEYRQQSPPPPPPYGYVHNTNGSGEFGADGQQQPGPVHYNGGTMPGPQYMLNMHPGVPVQVNRL